MSGRLIAIEGLDGVGKTTLATLLAERLGARCATTPGPEIRSVRARFDQAFNASPVARAVAYGASVLAAAEEIATERVSRDVVFDRYWLSTLVYAPEEAQPVLAALAAHVPRPDLTLLLELPEGQRARRLLGRGLVSAADAATLSPRRAHQLQERYRAQASLYAGAGLYILSASGSPDAVLQEALRLVRRAA